MPPIVTKSNAVSDGNCGRCSSVVLPFTSTEYDPKPCRLKLQFPACGLPTVTICPVERLVTLTLGSDAETVVPSGRVKVAEARKSIEPDTVIEVSNESTGNWTSSPPDGIAPAR